jgi:hypothetical protein
MVKKSKINKLTNRFVKSLAEKGIPAKYLILYGSYARGNPKPYSDIDIAVISPAFEGKGILKRQELLGEALYGLGEPIEALGYSVKEYQRPPTLSFLSEILSTGKLIYKS